MLRILQKKRIISITPGTSINFSSKGTLDERRCIFYILSRLFKNRMNNWNKNWLVEFFKSGFDKYGSWSENELEDKLSINKSGIKRLLSSGLKKRWNGLIYNGKTPIIDTILNKRPDRLYDGKHKGEIIGKMREAMALESLELIRPGLIIMDEFQNYRELLKYRLSEESQSESVKSLLMSAPKIPLLMVSATPCEFDEPDNYEELHKLVMYLKGEKIFAEPSVDVANDVMNLTGLFAERKRLLIQRVKELSENAEGVQKDKNHLLVMENKQKIEEMLRPVITRVERSLFLEENDMLVEETTPEKLSAADIRDFLTMRDILDRKIQSRNQLLHFWKSSQNLFNFIDRDEYMLSRYNARQYREIMRKMTRNKLLFSRNDIKFWKKLESRNYKYKRLWQRVSETYLKKPELWVSPAMRRYRSESDKNKRNEKLLIFSSWKFVPRAIAMLLSYNIDSETSMRLKDGITKSNNYIRSAKKILLRADYKGREALFRLFYPSEFLLYVLRETTAMFPNKLPDINEMREHVKKVIKTSLADMDCGDCRKAKFVNLLYSLDCSFKKDDDLPKIAITSMNSCFLNARFDPKKVNKGKPVLKEKQIEDLIDMVIGSPGIQFIDVLKRTYRIKPGKDLYDITFKCCKDGFVGFYNKHHSAIRLAMSKRSNEHFWRQILLYNAEFHFGEMLEEYAYLNGGFIQDKKRNQNETQELVNKCKKFVEKVSEITGIKTSSLRFNTSDKKWSIRSNFALSFNDDKTETVKQGSGAGIEIGGRRKTKIREAFNSPFWPFVLTTTSIGQEGLDFHLYCSNIIHWNLPPSPAKLEQREGRINRFNGYFIRNSIADADFGKRTHAFGRNCNVWHDLVNHAKSHSIENELKKGFMPNWHFDGSRKMSRILYDFQDGADLQKYNRLKKRLAYYRMAFGIADPEAVLEAMDTAVESDSKIAGYLRGYMINLAPDFAAGSKNRAVQKARQIVKNKELDKLIVESECKLKKISEDMTNVDFDPMQTCINELRDLTQGKRTHILGAKNLIQKFAEVLVYFLDPFDEKYDYFKVDGYDDDIKFAREIVLKYAG